VSDYELDDRAILVQSQAESKDFSSNLWVQTGFGANPVSYPMGTGGLLPGVKRSRDVKLTTHPHLVPRSWISRSYISSPACASIRLFYVLPKSCHRARKYVLWQGSIEICFLISHWQLCYKESDNGMSSVFATTAVGKEVSSLTVSDTLLVIIYITRNIFRCVLS
jgi:hypothetical protein